MQKLKALMLSVAIMTVALLLVNDGGVRAQDAGDLTLDITGGQLRCTYGKQFLAFTSAVPSFSDVSTTRNFNTTTGDSSGTNTRFCVDLAGQSTFSMTILASQLTGSNTGVIPSSRVEGFFNTASVVSGSCTANTGAFGGAFKLLSGQVVILGKSAAVGQVCRVDATGAQLKVTVPANTAVGVYTGKITITVTSS